MSLFDKHRNPDGTYNGVSFMAELSGLSQAEIEWTASRIRALKADGKTKAEQIAIVRDEAKLRPWEAR